MASWTARPVGGPKSRIFRHVYTVRRNLFQILEATNLAVCFKYKSIMESNFILTFLVLDKMWSTSAGTTERVLKWGS